MHINNKNLKILIYFGILPGLCNIALLTLLAKSNPGDAGTGVAMMPFVFLLLFQIVFCIFFAIRYVLSIIYKDNTEEASPLPINNQITPDKELQIDVQYNTLDMPATSEYLEKEFTETGYPQTQEPQIEIGYKQYIKDSAVFCIILILWPTAVLFIRLNSVSFLKDTIAYAGFIGYLIFLAMLSIKLEKIVKIKKQSTQSYLYTLLSAGLVIFIIILGCVLMSSYSSTVSGRLT